MPHEVECAPKKGCATPFHDMAATSVASLYLPVSAHQWAPEQEYLFACWVAVRVQLRDLIYVVSMLQG